MSARGVKVGYLWPDRAVWIGCKIDRGYDVRAIVERVRGEDWLGERLGIVVRINLEGGDPDLDEHWRGDLSEFA